MAAPAANPPPVSVRLVVLGDGGVGKTALTIQLCLNYFIETYDPTIEDSYRKVAVIDNEHYMLEILDTAGQEEYVALRDQWIREGEGFVLVYSIISRSTFERIERFKDQIERIKDENIPPFVLVGNKSDREAEREVPKDEGADLAKQLGCSFVETSAKTRSNLEMAYYTVVRQIREKREGTADKPMTKFKKMRRCTIL